MSKSVRKIPVSPSAAVNHATVSEIVRWMNDRGSSQKEKLNNEEKLNLYRFAVKSFNRFKSLVTFLGTWVDAFSEFSKLCTAKAKLSKAVDVQCIIRTWFIAFNEILDEFMLLKFGGIICEHDREEHVDYLVERNISTNEIFPNQEKYSDFTSCSFFGYRDLTKMIQKVKIISSPSFLLLICYSG